MCGSSISLSSHEFGIPPQHEKSRPGAGRDRMSFREKKRGIEFVPQRKLFSSAVNHYIFNEQVRENQPPALQQ